MEKETSLPVLSLGDKSHSSSGIWNSFIQDDFVWKPSGLTADQLASVRHTLPPGMMPRVGSDKARVREERLRYQLPAQDVDWRNCRDLTEDEKRELKLFNACRRRDALGRGVLAMCHQSSPVRRCMQCGNGLKKGSAIVTLSDEEITSTWHPGCFVCCTCDQLLVDLIFFHHDGELYCGRHHAEILKPRCASCDEIIFSDECTEAEGRTWHTRHFSCIDCGTVLAGRRYVSRSGRQFCTPCYEQSHAELCVECQQVIGIDEGYVGRAGSRWHAACFCCYSCHRALVDRALIVEGDKFYCVECRQPGSVEQAGGHQPAALEQVGGRQPGTLEQGGGRGDTSGMLLPRDERDAQCKTAVDGVGDSGAAGDARSDSDDIIAQTHPNIDRSFKSKSFSTTQSDLLVRHVRADSEPYSLPSVIDQNRDLKTSQPRTVCDENGYVIRRQKTSIGQRSMSDCGAAKYSLSQYELMKNIGEVPAYVPMKGRYTDLCDTEEFNKSVSEEYIRVEYVCDPSPQQLDDEIGQAATLLAVGRRPVSLNISTTAQAADTYSSLPAEDPASLDPMVNMSGSHNEEREEGDYETVVERVYDVIHVPATTESLLTNGAGRQRRDKQLTVTFDPSTKEAAPTPDGVTRRCKHRKSRSYRSGMTRHESYIDGYNSDTSGLRGRYRGKDWARGREESCFSDSEGRRSSRDWKRHSEVRGRGAEVRARQQWYDEEYNDDDDRRCSTCSSSSTDSWMSEYEAYEESRRGSLRQGGGFVRGPMSSTLPTRSLTLGARVRPASVMHDSMSHVKPSHKQKSKKKWFNKKNCVIS